MSRIALLSYNNYYNRLFKIEDSLSAYLTAATSYTLLDNINFNPADGVTTSLIVGKGQAPFTTWESGSPDYLIVYKTTTEDVIVSRWFILDEDRTRDGQWKISLRRDLLADFNEELATAPIYVEKGIIQDLDNPLLLNNESLVVNQIKKDEILLKDLSKCPWLVMYIKKGVLGGKPFGEEGSRTGVVTLDVPQDDSFVYKTLTVPFTQWAYHQYNTIDYKYAVRHEFRVNYKGIPSYSNTNGYKMYKLVAWNQQSSLTDSINMGTNLTGNTFIDKTRLDNQYKSRINTMVSQANSAFNYHDNADDLLTYNDKVIKDSTGKYYRIHVYTNTAETISNYTVTSSNASTLKNTMTNAWNAANNQSVSPNNSAFYCQLSWKGLRVS